MCLISLEDITSSMLYKHYKDIDIHNSTTVVIRSYWLTELTSIKIVKLMNNILSNITNRKILPTPGSENWKTLLA